jgi:hypothetical protein
VVIEFIFMFIHIENVNKNITFGIFLLSLVFLVGYASAADVNVTPLKKIVIQGQTFDLNISIDPRGTAIAGAQLKIGFNKSVIKINNIIEGNLFKQNGANTFFNPGTINNSQGTVVSIYDMILGPYSVSTPGAFIIINATAVGISGTSGINLSNVIASDTNGQAIDLNIINGSVNINWTTADVIVTTPTTRVIQGQTFDLNISIDPRGTAIAGAQLNIGFNNSVIKINNIKEGNLFKKNGANTFFNSGTINNSLGTAVRIYDMILGPYSVYTPGTFIIINATAVSVSDISGINLSNVIVSDPNGQAIALNVINGSVNINITTLDTPLPVMRFINGRVMDSVTKTGIPGVRVFINTSITTMTNETGFYSFAVVSGTYNITATFEPTYYVNSTTVSTALSAVVVHDIELLKKPTGTIAGVVRNAKL